MTKNKADLRKLYKQGEREAVFRKLNPKSGESDLSDFRKGLRVNHAQMELIEELVEVAFEESRLSDYDDLGDPVALTVLYKAIDEPVEWLSEHLPEVPIWFTTLWCEHIIKIIWKRKLAKLASQNANTRDSEKPRSVASPGPLLNEDISPRPSSPKTHIPFKNMICRIELLNQRDEKAQQVADLPVKRCLLPGRSADEFSSYSYLIFIGEFERVLNRDASLPLVKLRRGTVGYTNEEDCFRSIVRQGGFERALEHLYRSRGEKTVLEFIHRKESASERGARLDACISGATSPGSPGIPTQLRVPVEQIDRGRLGASSSRWMSPPPSPAPMVPLPPLPTGPSAQQIRGLSFSERAREKKTRSSLDTTAAEQARRSAIETIKVGARSTVSDTNKSLPLIPGGKARFSDKSLEILHAPEFATPRAPAAANKLQNATSSRQEATSATTKSPATKTRVESSPKLEPVAKKPFLRKGGGLSPPLPVTPATRISKSPRTHNPPPVSKQATKAWQIGNQDNPTPGGLPVKDPNTLGPKSSPPKKGDIKRGGTSRLRQHSLSYDGAKDEGERPNTSFHGPSLRPVEAKRTPRVVTPQTGPSRVPSLRVEREGWDTLTNPEDHTRRSPLKPRKLSIVGAAITGAKKRVSQLLTPKLPRPPATGDSSSDVQEIIDQQPKPRRSLTPPGPGAPRKSTSSSPTRIATAIKDAKVVVEPAKKKTFGLVKSPNPRLSSKIDRFDAQDKRYPCLYTEEKRRTYRRGGDEYVDSQAELCQPIEKSLGAQEIDEGESGDDEESKTPGDYMVEQFQKMQNLPELTQMYSHVDNPIPVLNGPWEACCELFQINPTKTSVDQRVTIAGLKTPIYQYQAYGVYWQMKNSRTIGGGFVADEMGLGKTLSFLAYIVVERQLAFLWEQVEKSRKQNDLKDRTHLQPGEAGPKAVCPRQRYLGPGWIACPCASPITAALTPKPGVRLAIVPPSLVPTWVQEWDTHVDVMEKMLQMSLVIAHDGSNTQTVDGKLDPRDGRHSAVVRRVQANRINFRQSARNSHGHFYPDQAQVGQERILVVTTRDHYNKTWATKFEYKTQVMPEDKNGVEDLYKGKAPGVVYGIAMIDECHEEWQRNKGSSGIVAGLPRSGRPFVWGYSGTPLTATPRSIEGILWAIESLWPKRDRTDKTMTGLEQEQDSEWWRYCWKTLNNICLEFEHEVKTGTGNHIIFQDFHLRFKPFLTMLMIRRTTDTPWFGHPLIKLKPHVHQDVILAHNPEYDNKIEQFRWLIDSVIEDKLGVLRKEWKSGNPTTTEKMPVKFSFNTEARLRYKQRIFATFPYLSVLGATHHPDHLDLTVEELKKFRGVDEKRNPYYKHLKIITEKSPKMMWLYNFITELDKTRDVNGEEQKVIIMSEFNQVAFIIKLWIEKHIRGKSGRVGIVYACQRPRDRKATIEAFTDAKDHKKERKQKANYQFLIGTTRIIGAGLQLTRSCNVVMMEPDYEFHRELQGYARVHRIGQRNPESRSYRLINASDQLEQSIIERQEARGQYPGRPDKVEDDDVELAEEIAREQSRAAPCDGDMDEETGALLEQFPKPGGDSNDEFLAPLTFSHDQRRPDSPPFDLYSGD